MKRVAIVHPWFPQYRREFFEQAVAGARADGIDLQIFHGEVPREWALRGDSVSADFASPLATRFIGVGGRDISRKSLGALDPISQYDLVILEHAVRNLETYELLLRGAPVAFWGHGKTYTKQVGRAQEKLKTWLARRGRWFFAYTGGGAQALADSGLDPARITVVNNSIDASALREQIRTLDPARVEAYEREHGLSGRTALFIGGLDSDKRLEFLLEAAALVHASDPDFRLIVAGDGPDADLVARRAARDSYVLYHGRITGEQKALALKASQVLAMPGRVGLVAVDSFAAETPIVTTSWPWHAPEFEYLSAENSRVTNDDVADYADELAGLLQNPDLLAELCEGCRRSSADYSTEAMVSNFLAGLRRALAQ